MIYDQTTGTPTGSVPVGSGTIGNGVAADDFTVPPGVAWRVDSFDLLGTVSGPGTLSLFDLSVVDDAGGLPGGKSHPVSASSPAAGNDLSLTTFGGTALGPGTYWLCAMYEGTGPTWAWTSQSPQHGSEGAWANYDTLPCHGFMHLSARGQPGPDLRFRVNGEQFTPGFKVGKKTRRENGGFLIELTFPVSGRFALDDAGKGDRVKAKDKGIFGKGPYALVVPVNPTVPVKTKLKSGKKSVKAKVKFTYAPQMLNPPPAAELTKTVKLVFKLPSSKSKK